MNKVLSMADLLNCQDYAERVVNLYKKCNNGAVPSSASELEMAVREYNSEHRSFKSLYGYSIRGYIDTIVQNIGFMVEC